MRGGKLEKGPTAIKRRSRVSLVVSVTWFVVFVVACPKGSSSSTTFAVVVPDVVVVTVVCAGELLAGRRL